jgi:hypothetical protein
MSYVEIELQEIKLTKQQLMIWVIHLSFQGAG